MLRSDPHVAEAVWDEGVAEEFHHAPPLLFDVVIMRTINRYPIGPFGPTSVASGLGRVLERRPASETSRSSRDHAAHVAQEFGQAAPPAA